MAVVLPLSMCAYVRQIVPGSDKLLDAYGYPDISDPRKSFSLFRRKVIDNRLLREILWFCRLLQTIYSSVSKISVSVGGATLLLQRLIASAGSSIVGLQENYVF